MRADPVSGGSRLIPETEQHLGANTAFRLRLAIVLDWSRTQPPV